jgi:hypothetical protein
MSAGPVMRAGIIGAGWIGGVTPRPWPDAALRLDLDPDFRLAAAVAAEEALLSGRTVPVPS